MYKLREFLTSVLGMTPDEVTSDELYCSESNTRLTFLTNEMQETLAGYSYTLVHDGWLKVLLGGRLLTLQRGDLMIYSPGVQVRIVSGSENYRSVCLIVAPECGEDDPKQCATSYTPPISL